MRRVDSLEKTLMLEGLRGGGEGDDRGWDGWMASPTQWTWVWVDSGSWLWTWRPGVLQFMGSQRVGHDWAAELNCIPFKGHKCMYMYYSYYINGVGLLCSCPRCPWTWQNQSLVSVLLSWQSLLIFAPLFHLFIFLTMFLALTGALYWTPFSIYFLLTPSLTEPLSGSSLLQRNLWICPIVHSLVFGGSLWMVHSATKVREGFF